MNEIKEIQNGNKEVLEQFIRDYDKCIDSIIKKYKNIYSDYEELKQQAIMKFIESIYAFDCNLDKNRFIQYFYARLTIEMRRYVFSNLDRIKSIEEKCAICFYGYDKCKLSLEHEPTYIEIADYLKINRKSAFEIHYIVNNLEKVVTQKKLLDKVYSNFEEVMVEKLENDKLKIVLEKILTKKQKEIIYLRYGCINDIPMSFTAIAEIYGITQQGVCNNFKCAEKKLIKKLPEIWYDIEEYTKRKVLNNSETN